MSVDWLQPLAWWGLAALAVPIVIHLVARDRRLPLPFPSLRFLHASRVTGFRRRVPTDAILLMLRLLILAAAVAAAASPRLVTASRQNDWQSRTARAIVDVRPNGAMAGDGAAALLEEERRSAFVSVVEPATGRAADAIASAVAWLERQPPAARELVFVGDVRAGLVTAADVAAVPAGVGIRFLPVDAPTPQRALVVPAIVADQDGTAQPVSLALTLEDEATRVVRRPDAGVADVLRVVAAPGEETLAQAIAAAVLAEGVLLSTPSDRRIVVELRGAAAGPLTMPAAAPWMRRTLESAPGGGGERDGALVVRVDRAASDQRAVHDVLRIARTALAEPTPEREPRRIPAATLAAWSRPAGPIPDSVPPADEGDRRGLWLAALLLLAVEHLVRRRTIAGPEASASEEARVA